MTATRADKHPHLSASVQTTSFQLKHLPLLQLHCGQPGAQHCSPAWSTGLPEEEQGQTKAATRPAQGAHLSEMSLQHVLPHFIYHFNITVYL